MLTLLIILSVLLFLVSLNSQNQEIYVCISLQIYIHAYIYAHIFILIYMCVYVYAYLYKDMKICIYIINKTSLCIIYNYKGTDTYVFTYIFKTIYVKIYFTYTFKTSPVQHHRCYLHFYIFVLYKICFLFCNLCNRRSQVFCVVHMLILKIGKQ